MKVKCISQCQKDRKTIYKAGVTYEIEDKMYQKNKEFFELIEKEDKKKKTNKE